MAPGRYIDSALVITCILSKLHSGDDPAMHAAAPTHVTLNILDHSMERIGRSSGKGEKSKQTMLNCNLLFTEIS